MHEIDHKSKLVIKKLRETIEDPKSFISKELLEQLFYIPGETTSFMYKIIKKNFKGKKKEKTKTFEIFEQLLKSAINTDILLELNLNDDLCFLLVLLSINSRNEELIK